MHHARARYCMEAAVAPHGLDRSSSARSFRFHHTHVVYVHVLKRYKREVRIYGEHCTVVVVRLVPPFGTPCFLGVLASEAQALLARSLYEVAAGSSLSVAHERAADKLI